MGVQDGPRAVVTGASGNLGEACCRRLLKDGYRVLGVDIDGTAEERLIAALGAGGRFSYRVADVRSEVDVEGYVNAATEWLGGIL
jgi:NAD(P)-dependent dehydrogenase (short-subunit alcohol dehydrogenase family)